MRLSEAIRLGSLTIEKPEQCNINACAVTMALNAVGGKEKDVFRYDELVKVWPWLEKVKDNIQCPWCSRDEFPEAASILYHPFDHHVVGCAETVITIEQLSDWIASIEPPEPRTGTTIDELTEMANEVLAPYLPPDWTKERWIRAMAEHRGEGE